MGFLKKNILALWHSSTFTEWGAKLLRPLRLLLVTPLILTRFSDSEIAAWYLFASVSFFGGILARRGQLTYSRMISLAHGGAKDLSPIRSGGEKRGKGEPNWDGILRVTRTLGVVRFWIAVASILIASVFGILTLMNVVEGEEGRRVLWAFFVVQTSSFLASFFDYYQSVLRGLGHVALTNRWSILTGLFSVLVGALTLSLGANILQLVLVMQLAVLLGACRNWFLFRSVEDGRLKQVGRPRLDKEIFGWSWEPMWKGFLGQLTNVGVIQVSGLIFSFHASAVGLASYLFSISMLRAIQEFAMTPFASQLPRFSRMMGAGEYKKLGVIAPKRIRIALWLFLGGSLAFGLMAPLALGLIGSKADLIGFLPWSLMTILFMHERFNTYSVSICAFGNNVVLYERQALNGLLSLGLMFALIPKIGVYGVLVALAVPLLLVMNFKPPVLAAKQLGLSTGEWIRRTYLPMLGTQSLVVLCALFLPLRGDWVKGAESVQEKTALENYQEQAEGN